MPTANNDDEVDVEDKAQRRILRNRISAAVSRERKKAYLRQLEQRVQELETELLELREENSKLIWQSFLKFEFEEL